MQVVAKLINALHDRVSEIAVEPNGTIQGPLGLARVNASPKFGSSLI